MTYDVELCNKTYLDEKYFSATSKSFVDKYKDHSLFCPKNYDQISIQGDRFQFQNSRQLHIEI